MELLPPTYREALVLRDLGQTLTEIAATLEIDVAAIAALLAIGEDKLSALQASR